MAIKNGVLAEAGPIVAEAGSPATILLDEAALGENTYAGIFRYLKLYVTLVGSSVTAALQELGPDGTWWTIQTGIVTGDVVIVDRGPVRALRMTLGGAPTVASCNVWATLANAKTSL